MLKALTTAICSNHCATMWSALPTTEELPGAFKVALIADGVDLGGAGKC